MAPMIALQPITYESFNIRQGTEEDVPAIADIDAEISGVYKRDYWENLFFSSPAEEPRAVFVAEHDERVLGFIVGVIRAWEFGSEPCGWVFAVSVRSDARESGVASALYRALCSSFRNIGIERIRTMILRDNHLIMSFFRSQGMMAGPFIQLEQDLSE